MPFQIMLNLLIAATWMFLNDTWSIVTFFIGYVIGMFFILFMRRFFPGRKFYGVKLFAIVKLFLLFIRELMKSSYIVLKQITARKITVQPGIFKLKTDLTSDMEITLLSSLITLTPGSVVMEVDPAEGILYIHAMDIVENEESVTKTKIMFEKAIMGVTR